MIDTENTCILLSYHFKLTLNTSCVALKHILPTALSNYNKCYEAGTKSNHTQFNYFLLVLICLDNCSAWNIYISILCKSKYFFSHQAVL